MNDLYRKYGQKTQNFDQMIEGIKRFQNAFQGDPTERLQSLLNSGTVPQNVLNRAQAMAGPIYRLMKGVTR